MMHPQLHPAPRRPSHRTARMLAPPGTRSYSPAQSHSETLILPALSSSNLLLYSYQQMRLPARAPTLHQAARSQNNFSTELEPDSGLGKTVIALVVVIQQICPLQIGAEMFHLILDFRIEQIDMPKPGD